MCIYVYLPLSLSIYIYICIHVCIYIYIYIYICPSLHAKRSVQPGPSKSMNGAYCVSVANLAEGKYIMIHYTITSYTMLYYTIQ